MNYFERNLEKHRQADLDRHARSLVRDQARDTARTAKAQRDFQLRCPHCGAEGQVSTAKFKRKGGIAGSKATAAILTAGFSLLVVGLSRKKRGTVLRCQNCGMDWTVDA
jgi:transcription elongation factor Elf1